MSATKVSVLKTAPSAFAADRNASALTLLLRVVPSREKWTWRLFSRVSASRAPRLIYADSKRYLTAGEATSAGPVALARAVAGCTVSGPKSPEEVPVFIATRTSA